MFEIIATRSVPDKLILSYCDESSQTGHKYFVVGGIYLIPKNKDEAVPFIAEREAHLQDLKKSHALNDRLKWRDVPSRPGKFFDGYKAFLDVFLQNEHFYFRCLVVNTSKYPLKSKKFMEGDPVVGYLKFYCVFLADGLMKRLPNYYFDIKIDQFNFDNPAHLTNLESSTNARFIMRSRPGEIKHTNYCEIRAVNSREHNLIQMADLLVGTVAAKWNRKITSPMKQKLIEHIEKSRSIDLCVPSNPGIHGFNIWHFNSK